MVHQESTTCQAVASFLDGLHKDGAFAYFWTIDRKTGLKRSYWYPVGQRPEAPSGKNVDVYFGVHTVAEIPTTDNNGKETDPAFLRSRIGLVDVVNVVFAEFDAKDFDGGKEAALAHVEGLALRPTVLVDSGGGYHAYWALRNPLYLESEEQRQDAADLQRAWVEFVKGDDGAKDLARVLRLPGTVNHKYPTKPEVAILWDSGPTHSEASIREACDDVLQALLDNRVKFAQGDYKGSTTDAEELIDALSYVPAQMGRYEDWVEMLMGIHSAFPGDEGIAIAENWSPGFPGEVARKWASFSVEGNGGRPVTVGTVYAVAKAFGWSHSKRFSMLETLVGKIGKPSVNGNGHVEADVDPFAKPKSEFGPFSITDYEASDGGIADLWLDLKGNDWLFVRGFDKWHKWTGTHWAEADEYEVRSEIARLMVVAGKAAKAMAEAYEKKAAEAEGEDADIAEAMAKKAKAYVAVTKRSKNRISSIYDLAIGEAFIGANDVNVGNLLNLRNGTLNLSTFAFRPHNRNDRLTYVLPYEYNPEAEAPRWKQYVDEVLVFERENDSDAWKPDRDMILAFQEAVGYTLTNSVAHEKMMWLSGSGGNGKSVAIKVLSDMLGEMSTTVDFHTIGTSGNYDAAKIPGRRLVFSTESAKGETVADEFVKKIVSGDPVAGRPIYGTPIDFRAVCKVWWAMNNKPRIKDTTDAMFRRIMLFPFNRTFDEASRDTGLVEKLDAELPGILNWALDGLRRLQDNGRFTHSDTVTMAVSEYKSDNDVIGNFLDEAAIFDAAPGMAQPWTLASEIYKVYANWAKDNGFHAMNSTNFFTELKRFRQVEKKRNKSGVMYNFGLRIDKFGVTSP